MVMKRGANIYNRSAVSRRSQSLGGTGRLGKSIIVSAKVKKRKKVLPGHDRNRQGDICL